MINNQMLNRFQPQLNTLKQAMNMVRSAGNPQAMLQQVIAGNPNYSKLQTILQQNNGDAKQAFYAIANQLGVDPNEIIGMLK